MLAQIQASQKLRGQQYPCPFIARERAENLIFLKSIIDCPNN